MDQVKTWGQALDFQMRRWKRLASAKTNSINSGHITRHVGRSYPISKLGKAGFWMNLQEELLDEGKSSSTVNRIVSAGTTVLRETHTAELHKTAVPKVKRLKEGQHRLTWFSKDDVEKLVFTAINTFDRSDIADAILFSAYTGVRQGELLKLKPARDLDLANGQIWVGGMPHLVTKGKNVRNIPIANRIHDLVMARKDNDLLFGCDWETKDQLYYQFCKVRDYCGFPEDHCWHTLRHTFGTWLAEKTQPRAIQALMGHAQLSTSMKYMHSSDEANRAAIAAL